MLDLRFPGAILLLCCGAICSLRLTAIEQLRLERAEGALALLREIRAQISRFSTPVSKILTSLDEELCARCGFTQGVSTLTEALANCLGLLPREQAEALQRLAASLGGAYRECELSALDGVIAPLARHCEQLRAELPRRRRVTQLLPLALSGALVLMLI